MNIGDLPGRVEGRLEAARTGMNAALAALQALVQAVDGGGG